MGLKTRLVLADGYRPWGRCLPGAQCPPSDQASPAYNPFDYQSLVVIPKPFTKVFLLGGGPVCVPPDLGSDQLQQYVDRIQAEMDRLNAAAERLPGTAAAEPLTASS